MNLKYLDDEVREGFYVPGIMKKCWAAQMVVLEDIVKLCEKRGLKYIAAWGSLLGAARHGGFVPWDDDLDICMPRKDYDIFCSIAQKELPSNYRIKNFANTKGHITFLTQVVSGEKYCFDEDYLKKYFGLPFVFGVDIFVMDYIYSDEKKEKERIKKVKMLVRLADTFHLNGVNKGEQEKLIGNIEKNFACKIDRQKDIASQLYMLADEMLKITSKNEARAIGQRMPGILKYDRTSMELPLDFFEDIIKLPYESMEIAAPATFGKMLKRAYGEFMTPRKDRGAHEYPGFKKQVAELEKQLGFKLPDFLLPDYVFPEAEELLREYGVRNKSAEKRDEKVVFVNYKPEYWKYQERAFLEEASKENVEIFVVALPYYYRSFDGQLADPVYEPELLVGAVEKSLDKLENKDKDINMFGFDGMNLESLQADRIYFQNPFDAYGSVSSVHPDYYSDILRANCEELIYIPFFKTDEFTKADGRDYYNMKYYCKVPGLVNADKIILQSQGIKDMYIEYLMENISYTAQEEEALKLFLHKKFEVRRDYFKETANLFGLDGEKTMQTGIKKKLLYYINSNILLKEPGAVPKKIKKAIDIMEKKKEKIDVWICVDSRAARMLEGEEALFKELEEELKRLEEKEAIKLIDGEYIIGQEELVAQFFDAFYGDDSRLARKFLEAEKPVMIESIGI